MFFRLVFSVTRPALLPPPPLPPQREREYTHAPTTPTSTTSRPLAKVVHCNLLFSLSLSERSFSLSERSLALSLQKASCNR
jgi:hypothetical protein